MPHALIVDDDEVTSSTLAELLFSEGFTASTAGRLAEARKLMALRRPDLVLLDLILPDGSGIELFEDVESRSSTEIVLMTGHASLESSIEALRLGAADYLVKPVNIARLKNILSRVSRPPELKAEIANLRNELRSLGRFGKLLGTSAAMQKVYDQIQRVAPTSATVLITGESGTGKELVAETIHQLSRRRKNSFLPVNCGAISPQLIESEMFGHEKGSFTGANRQHRGYFERAHGGTLFLDEVTEMPLDLQVKLLRVLETGTFMRVGSDQLIEADVRIIAATNRAPTDAVAEGKLREDLLYRLQVFPLRLPPLRDRLEDIELLAQHFLAQLNETESTNKAFSNETLQSLCAHRWPGNVRELKNAVRRAHIMADGDLMEPDDIPTESGVTKVDAGPYLTVRVGSAIADVERRLIFATLDQCGGTKERAADILGISLKTLYNRLREYGANAGGQSEISNSDNDKPTHSATKDASASA
jgi:two-component system, NtrC family, response regulator AtoC